MKVKLCGFTEENSLKVAIANKCDFLGFVFYDKSPRYITPEAAARIAALVPPSIAKAAVLVDPSEEFLQEITQKFHPDFFQFHGNETPDFLKKVSQKFPQIKIIKAVRISSREDLEQTKNFEDCVDFLMLDSKIKGELGGSGKSFDWTILQNFHSKKPWFLSGGLNVNNIEEALKISGATMIDVSSGIEEIRGKKSPKLINEFMKKIRDLN
jgi:phosphoribosylanthranilate isomerase